MSLFLRYLTLFGISMVPLVELRGALPMAYIYKANDPNFNLVLSYIIIAIGNMIPVPFIFFFARKVLERGAKSNISIINKFFSWCLEKGHKGGEKLQAKAGRGLFVALMLFVGIPLPGTGAWTGTLAASLLDMKFKDSVLAVICGVALASTIVGVLCTLGLGAWFGITGQ